MILSRRRIRTGATRLATRAVVAGLLLACAACAGSSDPAATDELQSTGRSSDDVASIVDRTQVSERMVDLTVRSPALGRRATVRVLLPPDHAAQPQARWPVLFLLHGCCDTYQSWTFNTDVEELSATSGVLVVMPEGGAVGFYSDWLNGPGWETFHTKELPELLRRDLGAGERRAIAGNSMGGLGALVYTARHPGQYAAAASFSGIVHTRLSPQTSRNYVGLVQSEGQGEDPLSLWGDPASASAEWAAHNPYDLADKLGSTPLFLSIGDGRPGPFEGPGYQPDEIEAALYEENLAMRDRLTDLGARATFSFYGPGIHNWPYWQRELHRAWPMFIAALVPAGQTKETP